MLTGVEPPEDPAITRGLSRLISTVASMDKREAVLSLGSCNARVQERDNCL